MSKKAEEKTAGVLVDEYIEYEAEFKKLKKEQDARKAALKKFANKYKVDTVVGTLGKASFSDYVRRTVGAVALYDRLPKDKFFKCVSVVVGNLKAHMGEDEIDELADVIVSERATVRFKKY